MLGFLSRQGRLIHYTTTVTVTTEVVIKAFDRLVEQKSPEAFAIVVLDNASIHHPALFQRKRLEWRAQRIHVVFLRTYFARTQSDRDVVAEDQVRMAATERLPELPVTL